MWYWVFLWALFSSLFVHGAAGVLMFVMLQRHKQGRLISVVLISIGFLASVTGAMITSKWYFIAILLNKIFKNDIRIIFYSFVNNVWYLPILHNLMNVIPILMQNCILTLIWLLYKWAWNHIGRILSNAPALSSSKHYISHCSPYIFRAKHYSETNWISPSSQAMKHCTKSYQEYLLWKSYVILNQDMLEIYICFFSKIWLTFYGFIGSLLVISCPLHCYHVSVQNHSSTDVFKGYDPS